MHLIERGQFLCHFPTILCLTLFTNYWCHDFSFASLFPISRVLKALTRKFKLHQDISLYSIAKKCPPNFTGADMYALCADAWFNAAKRKVSLLISILGALILVKLIWWCRPISLAIRIEEWIGDWIVMVLIKKLLDYQKEK